MLKTKVQVNNTAIGYYYGEFRIFDNGHVLLGYIHTKDYNTETEALEAAKDIAKNVYDYLPE